jgi:glycosyltransferase involved in cell wall biosynthesis
MKSKRIAFMSIMDNWRWGGSEELWAQTATRLRLEGHEVSASVATWTPVHERVLDLGRAGINVKFRPRKLSFFERAWRLARSDTKSPIVAQLDKFISSHRPDLVIFCNGNTFPDVDLLETCHSRSVSFATLAQANYEGWWPIDALAERYRDLLPKASACFFVSKANQRLACKQIGCELPNSQLIWNPISFEFTSAPPFPQFSEQQGLLLACVARLHPPSKGQDILLEALATPRWLERPWRLRLFGDGEWKSTINHMVQRLGLSEKVALCGHHPVYNIWKENQVLVMPSRYEGMPISLIEAQLCGRPAVVTAVAGNSEIIDDEATGFLASAATPAALGEALEKLWMRRDEIEQLGRAASKRIREIAPDDPIGLFSEKLKRLAS